MVLDAIKVGPLLIKYIWIIYAIAGGTAYFALKWRLKKDGIKQSDHIINETMNAAILAIVIWKFSYIFFHFQSAIERPLTMLYFNGGSYGLVLGAIGAIVYMVIQVRKLNIEGSQLIRSYLIAGLSGISIYWLIIFTFETNYYSLVQLLIALVLVMVAFVKDKVEDAWNLLLAFFLAQIFADYFQSRVILGYLFSFEQWIFTGLSLLVIFKDSLYKSAYRRGD